MEEQPFEVHLIKGPQGLGMSLTGGEMGGNGKLSIWLNKANFTHVGLN